MTDQNKWTKIDDDHVKDEVTQVVDQMYSKEDLNVSGNITGDDNITTTGYMHATDFLTASSIYKGDALARLSSITNEPTLSVNEFVKIDHSSLGDIAQTYAIPRETFDKDGNINGSIIEYKEVQSVDKSIGLLITANQQLLERLEELEARVNALELGSVKP